MILWILLIFLLACSFFFSGSETAITAVSTAQIQEMAKEGDLAAQKVKNMKENNSQLIGALLFGNNVVNIAITAISTSLCIAFFGENYGVLIATFGVSFVILVFSEILPKTYALQNPKQFSLKVSWLLFWVVYLLKPVVKGLDCITKWNMKLFGFKKVHVISEDDIRAEIKGALSLSAKDVLPQEKNMLKSVLELDQVSIEDIMVHRSKVVSLNAKLSFSEIVSFIEKSPYTRLPLWRDKRDNIVGLLHSKSLFRAMKKYYEHNEVPNLDDFITPPWFVLNTTSLLDQLLAFKKRREHFALVVDEYGVLQGIVTLEDVLEEIVGDISDETDLPEQDFSIPPKNENGSYSFAGSTTIRDLNRYLKWDLPDEEASTLAGFLMYASERIPEVDEKFTYQGFQFVVTEKDRNKLVQIEVTPAQTEKE